MHGCSDRSCVRWRFCVDAGSAELGLLAEQRRALREVHGGRRVQMPLLISVGAGGKGLTWQQVWCNEMEHVKYHSGNTLLRW